MVSLELLKETGQLKITKFEPVNTGEPGIHSLLFSPDLPFFALLCDTGAGPCRYFSFTSCLVRKGCQGYYEKKEFLSLFLGLWDFVLLWPVHSFPAHCVQETPWLCPPGSPLFYSSPARGQFPACQPVPVAP